MLSKHTEDLPWEGGFLHPTASAETAAFGTRRLLNGVQRSRHLGWDLDGKVGDPVHATQAGRVVVAARLFYSGGTVILDHGQGLFSLYFHLSALDVKKGQTVHRAQRVGRVGRSGRVTGPHLHFAFKLDGVYVDPERLLALPWPGTSDEGQRERPFEKRPIRVTAGVPSVSRAGASAPIGSAAHKEPS
jgi:murein DD-endopeptidase MepM/ murein hydrolase activator NlpD